MYKIIAKRIQMCEMDYEQDNELMMSHLSWILITRTTRCRGLIDINNQKKNSFSL